MSDYHGSDVPGRLRQAASSFEEAVDPDVPPLQQRSKESGGLQELVNYAADRLALLRLQNLRESLADVEDILHNLKEELAVRRQDGRSVRLTEQLVWEAEQERARLLGNISVAVDVPGIYPERRRRYDSAESVEPVMDTKTRITQHFAQFYRPASEYTREDYAPVADRAGNYRDQEFEDDTPYYYARPEESLARSSEPPPESGSRERPRPTPSSEKDRPSFELSTAGRTVRQKAPTPSAERPSWMSVRVERKTRTPQPATELRLDEIREAPARPLRPTPQPLQLGRAPAAKKGATQGQPSGLSWLEKPPARSRSAPVQELTAEDIPAIPLDQDLLLEGDALFDLDLDDADLVDIDLDMSDIDLSDLDLDLGLDLDEDLLLDAGLDLDDDLDLADDFLLEEDEAELVDDELAEPFLDDLDLELEEDLDIGVLAEEDLEVLVESQAFPEPALISAVPTVEPEVAEAAMEDDLDLDDLSLDDLEGDFDLAGLELDLTDDELEVGDLGDLDDLDLEDLDFDDLDLVTDSDEQAASEAPVESIEVDLSTTEAVIESPAIGLTTIEEPTEADVIEEPVEPEPVEVDLIEEPVEPEPVEVDVIEEPVQPEPVEVDVIEEPVEAEPVEADVIEEPVEPEPVEPEPVEADVIEEPVEPGPVEVDVIEEPVEPGPVEVDVIEEPVEPGPVEVDVIEEPVEPEPVEVDVIEEPVEPEPVEVDVIEESVEPEPVEADVIEEPVEPEPVEVDLIEEPVELEPVEPEPVEADVIEEPVEPEPVELEPVEAAVEEPVEPETSLVEPIEALVTEVVIAENLDEFPPLELAGPEEVSTGFFEGAPTSEVAFLDADDLFASSETPGPSGGSAEFNDEPLIGSGNNQQGPDFFSESIEGDASWLDEPLSESAEAPDWLKSPDEGLPAVTEAPSVEALEEAMEEVAAEEEIPSPPPAAVEKAAPAAVTPPHPFDQGASAQERRRLVRLSCNFDTTAYFEGRPVSVKLTDVSLGGGKLVGPDSFQRGQLIQVSNPLPEAKINEPVTARIVWMRPNKEQEDRFDIGLQFEESPEVLGKSWVITVLNKIGMQSKVFNQRKYTRAVANLPIEIDLMTKERYPGTALDIGLGGALLAVDRPLSPTTRFTLHMGPLGNHDKLELRCEVISSRHDEGGVGWTHSAKFSEISSTQTKLLGRYVVDLLKSVGSV